MNGFKQFIYKVVATINPPIMVFLLGGFVLSMICAVLILTPLYRGIPHRKWLAVSGAFPTIVLIYGQLFELFVRGRHFGIMLALSPVLLVFLPTGLSLYETMTDRERNKTAWNLSILFFLLMGQVWASLICWLATNSGFMGASC